MACAKSKHKQQLYLLTGIALLLLSLQIANALTNNLLTTYLGLWPRHTTGLVGVVCAPFLHGNWSHLFANLPVLLVLSAVAMWDSVPRYLKASTFIILGSGLLVWMLGRNNIHVGASGWVFGLWAWLIARAIVQRSLFNIIIAAAVAFFYSSLIWGLLPQNGVSFEFHLAGVCCGLLCAFSKDLR